MPGKYRAHFVGKVSDDKTGSLIREGNTMKEYGDMRGIAVKPNIDSKGGHGWIESRGGERMEAIELPVENPQQWLAIIRQEEQRLLGGKFQWLLFDEVQFYPSQPFYRFIRHLLELEYDIFTGGLKEDFGGNFYETTAGLALLAEKNSEHLKRARCTVCRKPAEHSQRLMGENKEPARYGSQQTIVDGSQPDTIYESRCSDHYSCPERPYPY